MKKILLMGIVMVLMSNSLPALGARVKPSLISWFQNQSEETIQGIELQLHDTFWTFGNTPWNLEASKENLEFTPQKSLELGIFGLMGPPGYLCHLEAKLIINNGNGNNGMSKIVTVPCKLAGVAVVYYGTDFKVFTNEEFTLDDPTRP